MKTLLTKLLFPIVVILIIFIVTHPSTPDFVTKLFINEKTTAIKGGKKINEFSSTVGDVINDMESATYIEPSFPK